MTAARTRAERCFALARSTPFPAEKATAIARGEKICAKAGLPLDDFDIPGRTRARRPGGRATFTFTIFESARDETLEESMNRLRETLRRAAERAGARDGETVYDARRRNFDAACAEAAARDRANGRAA